MKSLSGIRSSCGVLRQLPRRAQTRKIKAFVDVFQAMHKQTAFAEGKQFCVNFVYMW